MLSFDSSATQIVFWLKWSAQPISRPFFCERVAHMNIRKPNVPKLRHRPFRQFEFESPLTDQR